MPGTAPWKAPTLLGKASYKIGTYAIVAAVVLFFLRSRESEYILFRQDLPVVALLACLLVAMPGLIALLAGRPPLRVPDRLRPWVVLIAIAAIFAATAAGTWLVFGDYPLSRDEVLANFDADFLKTGALVGRVPAEWQPFVTAMNPLYMLPLSTSEAWLSAYLPGNAALRAIADLVVGKEWTNPALAALAAFALFRIARRLWPDDRNLAAILLVVFATSPQLLVTAMTPFAMTGHLAFNLLWLWCFLRDDRRGDAGALAAGFVATGLHQIVFHPIFVLPFLVELLVARRWRRLAVFCAGYALIGLFWASYWSLVLAGAGVHVPAAEAAAHGLPYLAGRVAELLASFEPRSIILMLFNLLRFAAWQHLLLLPLALLGWQAVRRAEGIARPLAGGIVLMLVTVLILLPWQGNGWGYRYLHGFLGSFCLLAGYGWTRIAASSERQAATAVLALTTALTLLVALPIHLFNAHFYVKPYRVAYQSIARSAADVVLVDPTGLAFTQDLVRNAPDAANRPKILDIERLNAPQLRSLCARYNVGLFDRRHGIAAGIPSRLPAVRPPQIAFLHDLGCAVPIPLVTQPPD